jgi:biopolymer transport protein ExbD
MSDDEGDDVPTLGHRRKTVDVGELDITPMIDVTFLLLIFFMVTSTMKEPATADVPPARHGVGTDSGEAFVITVARPEGDDEATVILPDDSRHSLADLRQNGVLAAQVKAAVESDTPRTEIVINADRDLPHSVVREVSQMVGEVEGIRLFLGVQDQ